MLVIPLWQLPIGNACSTREEVKKAKISPILLYPKEGQAESLQYSIGDIDEILALFDANAEKSVIPLFLQLPAQEGENRWSQGSREARDSGRVTGTLRERHRRTGSSTTTSHLAGRTD